MKEDRRVDERRSPVGDVLLGALALRSDGTLPYAELLQIAGESGLNMSTVLAWAALAEEAGLIEQQGRPDGGGRALALTEHGAEVARNDRRHSQRRDALAEPARRTHLRLV